MKREIDVPLIQALALFKYWDQIHHLLKINNEEIDDEEIKKAYIVPIIEKFKIGYFDINDDSLYDLLKKEDEYKIREAFYEKGCNQEKVDFSNADMKLLAFIFIRGFKKQFKFHAFCNLEESAKLNVSEEVQKFLDNEDFIIYGKAPKSLSDEIKKLGTEKFDLVKNLICIHLNAGIEIKREDLLWVLNQDLDTLLFQINKTDVFKQAMKEDE